MKLSAQLTTRKIALVAVFSALYYVLSFLPGIKVATGTVNVSIQIEAFMASIFGLMMGPYLGALTAFMGAFLAWLLPPGSPSLTSAIFLPSPAINALLVGLIYNGRWKIAFLTLAAVVSSFWLLPLTQPWDQYAYVGFFAMWDKIIALTLIVASVMLMKRMPKSLVEQPPSYEKTAKRAKADLAFILSLIAAVSILINAWAVGSAGNPRFEFAFLGTSFRLNLISKEIFPVVAAFGYFWLSLGVGILICAILLYFKPEKRVFWGVVIFLLSCTSALIGGGFVAGLFFGVLGGIFGILKEKLMSARITLLGDMSLYFLLAFIGNESDNALGNVIFAIPFVYEGIFQMPLDILRISFTVLPFFYFAIRLLQAIITVLIATPLLRNLKAAGLSTRYLTESQKHGNEKTI